MNTVTGRILASRGLRQVVNRNVGAWHTPVLAQCASTRNVALRNFTTGSSIKFDTQRGGADKTGDAEYKWDGVSPIEFSKTKAAGLRLEDTTYGYDKPLTWWQKLMVASFGALFAAIVWSIVSDRAKGKESYAYQMAEAAKREREIALDIEKQRIEDQSTGRN
eukprot:Clim_evm34s246 gene=Clim_evmTU34s246